MLKGYEVYKSALETERPLLSPLTAEEVLDLQKWLAKDKVYTC